jgi:leucyl aminopeptidase
MLDHLTTRASGRIVPIAAVAKSAFKAWRAEQPRQVARWLDDIGFKATPGRHALLPDGAGGIARVLLIVRDRPDIWSYGDLPGHLPEGTYRLQGRLDKNHATRAALGWALGGYVFSRYKKPKRGFAKLQWPATAERAHVERMAEAIFLVRDLITTPAADMGPAELAEAARRVARTHKARFSVILGEALLKANYPLVHAVGRASTRPPRLIDMRWGGRGPKITLVGKGVCFDSGGLDLKPSGGMLNMKKDMGGAAHVLALGQMIMAAKLPVRLRVLIPAVENSVSGNAMRPLDIVRSRKGLTVEIGNTDAEGRLILCDALAEADREKPDLIVDFATLTGAARVALGPDLPALFANDDAAAQALLRHGTAEDDPLWRLPLWKPYRKILDSSVADISSTGQEGGGSAGAINAALFLSEFVSATTPWLHIDLAAWNGTGRPGRPKGGEAQVLRALYAMIAERAGAGAKRATKRKQG